ncbi:tyrosine-type recombinase/integrase [Sinorhizobium medicae]|uniref:tyrosine-type recombinase/integrase n=2 Tax=Sinorhizobium medicae TaxID=110321 RepID=UPI000C7BFF51|nr:site-specific integrase [Sinorhizobium medicae]MDX0487662.1 tyrosine-type recombinase/integrase [Sinorhizobium medicae]MDX0494188.1 tyrosine-type recombinase/integrase [Sinorhizobium medicae]MDX0531408.1 tyrosine-type recombinase/integrase [Sinorhizobium medicae]MDX0561662.1 tyrosine-type recombinase/integrase [Sinorhizobium medicae]MDX0894850.1 tyrosine-type recombinase/integrase [Sinorhizobium medicae]
MSVRKRTWTTPKGVEKSAWVVDYFDMAGKRRLKTFTKKKDADAFAATAKVEVREGVHVADSASATIEEAGKLWLASARAAGLERATIEDYERHLRMHIVPHIGASKLPSLSIAKIRSFEDQLREAGRSAAMIKKVLVSLGSLLADAQERGLVARNVVRDMKGRRGNGEKRQEKRQKGRLKVGIDIPTREEVKALVGILTGRWRPLILTATFCGLRASELRGLRWQDVDLEKREVRVHQRADRFNDIGRPKSISGERTVPAPPMVINALREWKLSCPKKDSGKTDASGEKIMVLDLVFPNGTGKVEQLNNILRRGLHPAWVAAGVAVDSGEVDEDGKPVLAPKYTGMHALRHFYASWCINRRKDGGLELPPKVVQERLGHSSIMMTMDVYGHLFPRSDDADEMAEAERAFLA